MEQQQESPKFAIVTGSSSGIGLAITEYLLENGYVVFGASRSGTDLVHGHFIDVVADVRQESSIEELYSVVSETTDSVHLLVNNAGICEMYPIEETSSKEFSDHFATNTLGAFHLLKHFRKFVIEGETHIVTTMGMVSKRSYPNMSAYCASKSALKSLVDSCKSEWKKLDVKFTNLLPGAVDTPLWSKMQMDVEYDKSQMLTIEEFMYVFDMIVKAPHNVQFPELAFLHRSVMSK